MTRATIRSALTLGLGAIFSVACVDPNGDSRPAPSELEAEECPAVPSPCGGNLVGKWQFVDACALAEPTSEPSCPGAKGTVVAIEGHNAGESFFSDGTTVSTGALEQILRYDMPISCWNQSCDAYGRALQGSIPTNYKLTQPVLCEQVDDTCVCSMGVALPVPQAPEQYEVSDTQVTIGGVPADYCVEGDRLTMFNAAAIVIFERK